MIEQELQELASKEPDRALEHLEADIWATLARREQTARRRRGLLLLQAALLLVVLAGSTLAGRELGRRQAVDTLAVFRPQLLFEQTLLAPGEQP